MDEQIKQDTSLGVPVFNLDQCTRLCNITKQLWKLANIIMIIGYLVFFVMLGYYIYTFNTVLSKRPSFADISSVMTALGIALLFTNLLPLSIKGFACIVQSHITTTKITEYQTHKKEMDAIE